MKFYKNALYVVMATMLLSLAACGDLEKKSNGGSAGTAVTGVNLYIASNTIADGTQTRVIPVIEPSNATNKNVTYSYSTQDVVTVDSNNNVIANGVGTTVITVTTEDGSFTDTVNIEVVANPIALSDITLAPANNTISIGDTYTLTPTLDPANATNVELAYDVQPANIVEIDDDGVVTGSGFGNATISVIASVDGTTVDTATATVNVTDPTKVTGVTLDIDNNSIDVGETAQLTTTVSPDTATNKGYAYTQTSTDGGSVTFNGDNITGATAGTVTITVTTDDGDYTASLDVVVSNVPLISMTLEPADQTIGIGATYTLTPILTPTNATVNIEYTTDPTGIVTVSDNGTVEGIVDGNTTITATDTISGVLATATVTVDPTHAPVIDVTLTIADNSIAIGGTTTLTPTFTNDPSNKNVTYSWTSTNGGEVTIAGNTVTGVQPGTVTITATTEEGGFVDSVDLIITSPTTGVELLVGDLVSNVSMQLVTNVFPDNATDKGVTYSVPAGSFATVTDTGIVSGDSTTSGTVVVTVTTDNGSFTDSVSLEFRPWLSHSVEGNFPQLWSIYHAIGLQEFGERTNTFNQVDGKLMNDISLDTIAEWTPIANNVSGGTSAGFAGTFDGAGHVISGLTIDNTSANTVGLFSTVSGTVQNVVLRDVLINAGTNVGAIAGEVIGGTIKSSYVVNADITGTTAVGGIVGYVHDVDSNITGNYVTFDNLATATSNGVYGNSADTPTITQNYFITTNATVTSTEDVAEKVDSIELLNGKVNDMNIAIGDTTGYNYQAGDPIATEVPVLVPLP